MVERRNDRWAAHPVWAGVVRVLVFLVPLVLSVLAGIGLARVLPVGHSTAARVGWFVLVFLGSSVVLFAADRLARRLLPLAVLLELSLVFPDRAPSRLRSVRTPSVRSIEQRLIKLRAQGATTPPLEAAETLVTLVGVLGLHDKRTRGHSERVRAFVDLITDEMGLPDEERSRARWAALVHDMGKLTVPAAVLNKTGSLDEDEWETVRRHPDEGVRLVAGLLPWLGDWGRAIGEHHERWDGLGYPSGLAGENISLAARIVAVADSFEVMTSARSYNRALSSAAARQELTSCAGAQFDPQVVRVLLSVSLGRLRWVLGPLTWLAQWPFLALERSGQVARLGVAAVGIGGAAAAGVVVPPAAASAPPPAAADRVAQLPADLLVPSPVAGGTASPAAVQLASPAAPRLVAPSAAARLPQPSGTTAAPVPAPAPVRTTAQPAPARAPSTYWFAARGALVPTAPTRTGSPPDVDGDGRPGATVLATNAGLDTGVPRERLVLSLAVDRPLRLNGVPTVVLWSRLVETKGNARVEVRLSDCTAAGSCTVLAEGHRAEGVWSSGTSFVRHDIDLAAVDVTVPKGHRLRLTLVAQDAGTKGDLLVGMASRSAPSRLVLPIG
ncbi:MAG: HD domain-containing protein [Actinobacteria bacterium]|nr:HD domain-containing protein [Actinomycetota bacterium]